MAKIDKSNPEFPLGPNVQTFVDHVMMCFEWAGIDETRYHPGFCHRKEDGAPGFHICTRPDDPNSMLHCFEDGLIGLNAEYGTMLCINEDLPATQAAIAAVSVILTYQPTGRALAEKALADLEEE